MWGLVGVAWAGPVSLGCPPVGAQAEYHIVHDVVVGDPGAPLDHVRSVDRYGFEVLALGDGVLRMRQSYLGSEILLHPKDPSQDAILEAFTEGVMPPVELRFDLAAAKVAVVDLAPVLVAYEPQFEAAMTRIDASPEQREQLRAVILDPRTVQESWTQSIVPVALFTCRTTPSGRSDWADARTQTQQQVRRRGGTVAVERVVTILPEGGRRLAADLAERGGADPAEAAAVAAKLSPEAVVSVGWVVERDDAWPDGWEIATETRVSGRPEVRETYRAERAP